MNPTESTTMANRRLRDRVLAGVLSLLMAASMVPTSALAEAVSEVTPAETSASTPTEGAETTASAPAETAETTEAAPVEESASTAVTAAAPAATAATAVTIVNVSLSTTDKLVPGDTVIAMAKGANGADVTSNADVSWSWYAANSEYATGEKIEGATGSSLTITSDLLGKYIYASADGGFGATKSPAAGPIAEAGAVTLYKVTVDASGSAKVGQTLTATAYTGSYAKASSTDIVHYQWQWASAKTTSDSAFTDIPDATSATFTIPQTLTDGTSLLGKYLRVKATSNNLVVFTSVPSNYGASSQDPVGPVALAGGYDVSSVKLSSTTTNAQVGATLTAKPQYEKASSWGSYETDLPSDARLTCTWYVADDAAGTNARELTAADGANGTSLELSSPLEGKYVWVTCSSLMASASSEKTLVKATGAYDLHHVVLSPSSGTLIAGDTAKATVYASQLSGSNADVTGKDGVNLQWYVAARADAPSAEWQPLVGCTSASLQVPAAAAGKYLKVTATSGTTSVSGGFAQQVVSGDSLAGATTRLQNENWRPSLTYGTDTNINDVLLAKLAKDGVDTTGLTVRVSSVSFSGANASAKVGISSADADNGTITYFSCDTDKVSSWSISSLQTVKSIEFTLTRGDETVTYNPSRTFQVPWDEDAARSILQKKVDAIALGFADGDSAASVTQPVTLPASLNGARASWASNDSSVSVTGESWDSSLTATVTRGSADKSVTLAATVSFTGYGMPDVTVTKDFPITVKADPEAVAAAKAGLGARLEAGFTYDKVTAFSTGDAVDHAAVSTDLQLPTTRTLGVDGKHNSVSYSSGDALVIPNGYRATVVRPLGASRTVTLTCTITDKSNPEITASKSLEFTLLPISEQDIDTAVSLMEKAKAGYAEALLDGQDPSDIAAGLHAFLGAYENESGDLAWARDRATQSAHPGIVAVELPGYDAMAGMAWRTFRSSRPDIISNEVLAYTKPTDTTRVTITSRLSDERYQAYYAYYKDDPTVSDQLKAKLASLVDQDVSATFTIKGTSGEDAPESITASCSVIGPSASGENTSWAPETSLAVEPGTTAAELTKRVLDANGITYDSDLYTFTKDGSPVGYNAATNTWWQLFINGKSASVMASNYILKEGDKVVWYYSKWGDSLPGQVTGSVKVIGKDASGNDQVWATTTSLTLVNGSTAADLSEAVFAEKSLVHKSSATAGYYLSSITSPHDGRTLGWDSSTKRYWQLFVNGRLSDKGAGSVAIADGDEVVWYYAADGDSLPASDAVVLDPTAARPTDLLADWAGYKGNDGTGVVRGLATPIPGSGTYAKLDWAQSRSVTSMFVNASDAIIVNGDVYDAAQKQLYRRDASTGVVLAEARLAETVDSTARLQYTDGLILVPLHNGRIQALTADKLTTVWISEALPASTSSSGASVEQQTLSSITVHDGHAYFSTVAPEGADSCGGYVACVSLKDGSLVWKRENSESVGYYWTGVTATSAGMLTADDAGNVYLLDAMTGNVVSSLSLGTRCRAQIVMSGNTAYAVTTDGALHEIFLGADGSLTAGRSLTFGSFSTSTPTICDGKMYVGGSSAGDLTRGALFVIDLASWRVEHEVLVPTTEVKGQVGTGDVKSAPLVNVVADGNTYVYFTCNGAPGGAYAYRLGDTKATTLFRPAQELWQYCMSSIACDAKGNLYFYNDSGYLFKLDAGLTVPVSPEPSGDETDEQQDVQPPASGVPNGGKNPVGKGTPQTPASAKDTSASGTAQASEESLLGGFSSTSVTSTSTATTGVGDTSTGLPGQGLSAESLFNLPIWPIVGTCVGLAALFLLAVTRRREGDEDADGRRS
ncbi:DUF4430 domain-containing protein [Olsenella sp. Marseille-P4559]|uniref:DUF4430 domain-containing protein n=1 Tax=Olsenella sp. Marseille-P4559 TaxID=2364795 RepID=UPI00102F3F1F|nr:DUF4430 domain-containing protein [Olsenella sp. Marseille-P4559]